MKEHGLMKAWYTGHLTCRSSQIGNPNQSCNSCPDQSFSAASFLDQVKNRRFIIEKLELEIFWIQTPLSGAQKFEERLRSLESFNSCFRLIKCKVEKLEIISNFDFLSIPSLFLDWLWWFTHHSASNTSYSPIVLVLLWNFFEVQKS